MQAPDLDVLSFCTIAGRCEAAEALACGSGGLACAACSGTQACESGQCAAKKPVGCGCSGAAGASALLGLMLLARRRR